MNLKKINPKHKNNKLWYYTLSYFRQLLPVSLFQSKLKSILKRFDEYNQETQEYILNRVNYYNQLSTKVNLSKSAKKLLDISLKDELKTYFFDFYEINRYFDRNLKVCYRFGDVRNIPDEPTIVKSRPITKDNGNSVILKLNKIRHFTFVKNDKLNFKQKKDQLIARNNVFKHNHKRNDFYKKYFTHPLCDLGKINKGDYHPEWYKPYLSIEDQLKYKFILCIEGNDVASNLKWVMSSNSLAVMPAPKYETWFMEGKLIGDYHYVEIKEDYSDLEQKLIYYIENPHKAEKIISNANKYVEQFKDKKMERLIAIMVLEKYFKYTGQL